MTETPIQIDDSKSASRYSLLWLTPTELPIVLPATVLADLHTESILLVRG